MEVIGTMATKRLFSCAIGLVFATHTMASASSPTFASWKPSAGPPGGVVSALAAVNLSLYAGTDHGLYRSTDGGASWRLTGLPLEFAVKALAATDHVILAGTFGGGVFRREDVGDSWTPADEGLPQGASLYVDAFAVSDCSVFAVVSGGLYESTDAGGSWIPRGPIPAGGINSLAAVGGSLYGAASPISPRFPTGGVYKSTDRGMTWTLTSELLSNQYVNVIDFSNGFLYAGTQGNGIYRSSDQGMNWTASDLMDESVTSLITVGSSLYAGALTDGVFKSGDDGGTWVRTALSAVDTLSLTSLGSTLYSGTRVGIYRSDDGGNSWAVHNSGLANTYIAGLWTVGSDVYAQVGESDYYHAHLRLTLYRSTDSGLSWMASGSGLPIGDFVGVSSLVSDGHALYAGVAGVGVYKSTDRGVAWSPVGSGLPVAPRPYTLVARSDLVLVGIQNQVFRSMDAGMTWSSASAGLSNYLFVQNMAFAGNNVYGATDSGVVKSLDGGASWQATGLTAFTRLVVASADAVYAVTSSSGVLRSRDGGGSWTQTALDRNDIYSLATFGGWLFAANVGNALGAGQKDDVFVSSDGGASWTAVEQNLFVLGGVTLASSDNALYAGTQGYGVQTLTLLPDRQLIQPPLRPHSPRVVPIRR